MNYFIFIRKHLIWILLGVFIVIILIFVISPQKDVDVLYLNSNSINKIVIDEYSTRTTYSLFNEKDVHIVINLFDGAILHKQRGVTAPSGIMYTLYFYNDDTLIKSFVVLSHKEIRYEHCDYLCDKALDLEQIAIIIKRLSLQK